MIESEGQWIFRAGEVASLTQLFLYFGREFAAARLYRYDCPNHKFVVNRPHDWTTPERQAAARMRYTETCDYGHGATRPAVGSQDDTSPWTCNACVGSQALPSSFVQYCKPLAATQPWYDQAFG